MDDSCFALSSPHKRDMGTHIANWSTLDRFLERKFPSLNREFGRQFVFGFSFYQIDYYYYYYLALSKVAFQVPNIYNDIAFNLLIWKSLPGLICVNHVTRKMMLYVCLYIFILLMLFYFIYFSFLALAEYFPLGKGLHRQIADVWGWSSHVSGAGPGSSLGDHQGCRVFHEESSEGHIQEPHAEGVSPLSESWVCTVF